MSTYPDPNNDLRDANDVARYLKASRSWLYHHAEAGRLLICASGASCASSHRR